MEIAEKIVVVTGGASGIGRALVERFAKDKARHVVSVDRVAHVSAYATCRVCDVADGAAVAALVEDVEKTIGPIDAFCSNAGVLPIDPDPDNAASLPDAEWTTAWEVNVMAHVYAARALLPRMIARKAGYFVQTVSAAGLLSQIGSAAYSTTKHAAIGFAESLAITHRDHGIRVSIVCPQAVGTAMIEGKQMNGADIDGVITADAVAEATVRGMAAEQFLILPHPRVAEYVANKELRGMAAEQFLILPHPRVAEYVANKAASYDRWIGGMAKLRRQLVRS